MQYTYSYKDTANNSRAVTFYYSNYTVKTNFLCSGINDYAATAVALVSTIVLANGDTYTLTYEPTPGYGGDVTGRIASIKLPSGGTITYNYSGGNAGLVCADGSTAGLSRTTPDSSSAWTYTRSNVSGNEWSTTVVSPPVNAQSQSMKTIYFFEQAKKANGSNALGFYEVRRAIYDFSGNLNSSEDTCYASGCSANAAATVTLPITSMTKFINQDVNRCSSKTVAVNSVGQPTTVSEYGSGTYASGVCTEPSGSLLRQTSTTYSVLGNGASVPTQVSVYAGSNLSTPVSQTNYAYDGSTVVTNENGTSVPQHIAVTGARGNLTSITRWGNTSPNQTTTVTYWDTGNVKSVADPGGHVTNYDWQDQYDSGNANTQAFLTTITYPQTGSPAVNHVETRWYNFPSGRPWKAVDQNGNTTSIASYDLMLRPVEIDRPDGGKTTFTYTDSGNTGQPPIVDTKTLVSGTTWLDSQVKADSLGRASRSIRQNGAGGYDQTDVCYDSVGRVSFRSNPYQGSGFGSAQVCASAGDSYTYDFKSRVITLTHADGSTVQSEYYGEAVQVQDEGVTSGSTPTRLTKVFQYNPLGFLTSVCEGSTTTYIDNTAPANCAQDIWLTGFVTSYGHDVMGRLTNVWQGAQQRVYNYNALGQLTGVGIPEMQAVGSTSPTVFTTFTYDSEGKLLTRVRPAPNGGTGSVTTTYGYDALHRPTSISYNDSSTPTATYVYDAATKGIGALSSASVAGNISTIAVSAYDVLGRPTTTTQCTPFNCGTSAFNVGLAYDLAGDLTSETDPNYTLSYGYDSGLRLSSVTSNLNDANHPPTLFSAAQYNGFGELTSASLGNGLTEVNSFDPNTGRVLSSGAGTSCNLSTSSCGTYQYYVGSMSYSGDGTVLGANDSVNGSWTHSYDDLGRILTSTQSGGSAFTFGTDHYGNRAAQTLTAGSGPQSNLVIDKYTNKITTAGFVYDAVGNLTNDGIHAYKYDAENRIIGVDDTGTTYTARYKYDAAGRRVEKQISGQDTIDYVYDSGSNAATRIDATTGGTWLGSDIFAAGHLATYTGGTTYFNHADWLGSERVRTNVSGIFVETCSNLAYGDNIAASLSPDCTGTDVTPFHFTGYEHDNESGLDHAWFRYYNPRIGRFMSTDLLAGSQDEPQSLNKATYVINGPLNYTDSLGLGHCPHVGGDTCDQTPPMIFNANFNCTLDGAMAPCGSVAPLVEVGAAAICPNNNCDGYGYTALGFVPLNPNGSLATEMPNGSFQYFVYNPNYDPNAALSASNANLGIVRFASPLTPLDFSFSGNPIMSGPLTNGNSIVAAPPPASSERLSYSYPAQIACQNAIMIQTLSDQGDLFKGIGVLLGSGIAGNVYGGAAGVGLYAMTLFTDIEHARTSCGAAW